MPDSPNHDVIIVGGGIVGLATAYRLLQQRPSLNLAVLERATAVGTGQSGRNSGVVHAGIYYAPGSAKARWCTAGKRQLEEFCQQHGVPFRRSGKLVAAVSEDELPGLAALEGRARENGVEVHPLTASEAARHEPHARVVAGLWSPSTAVVDFGAVCRALAERVVDAGGHLQLGAEVVDLDPRDGHVVVHTDAGRRTASHVVVCGGLQADRLARLTTDLTGERIIPFRGSWLQLRPDQRHRVRGNIYPVPTGQGLPFLGVHLTRRINDDVWIGPNAVLALAREGEQPWSVDPRDLAESLSFPGVHRLAARYPAIAASELFQDLVLEATLRQVRRYVPGIRREHVRRGPWGVRAQLVDRSGSLVDDFVIRRSGRVVHVLNAPSPAATASLAIGEAIRDEILAA